MYVKLTIFGFKGWLQFKPCNLQVIHSSFLLCLLVIVLFLIKICLRSQPIIVKFLDVNQRVEQYNQDIQLTLLFILLPSFKVHYFRYQNFIYPVTWQVYDNGLWWQFIILASCYALWVGFFFVQQISIRVGYGFHWTKFIL